MTIVLEKSALQRSLLFADYLISSTSGYESSINEKEFEIIRTSFRSNEEVVVYNQVRLAEMLLRNLLCQIDLYITECACYSDQIAILILNEYTKFAMNASITRVVKDISIEEQKKLIKELAKIKICNGYFGLNLFEECMLIKDENDLKSSSYQSISNKLSHSISNIKTVEKFMKDFMKEKRINIPTFKKIIDNKITELKNMLNFNLFRLIPQNDTFASQYISNAKKYVVQIKYLSIKMNDEYFDQLKHNISANFSGL